MNSLYKRFVTMSMISISSILAWIYCLVEFRDKPLYIGILSAILIFSVLALFISSYNIKVAKDTQLEQYINTTINTILTNMVQKDNEELERLSKALYVQLRKSNTILSKMAEDNQELTSNTQTVIAESIDKALKLSIKYSQLNNDRLIENGTGISSELTDSYKELVNALNKLNKELISLRGNITATPYDNDTSSAQESLDIFETNESDTNYDTDFTDAYTQEVATDETLDMTNTDETSYDESESTLPEDTDTSDIANDFFNEFGAAIPAEPPVEENTNADVIPFPVAETQPADDSEEKTVALDDSFDSNKPMSADEIAALFASMDAATESQTTEEAFTEEPVAEPENPGISADFDPNKPMSPEDIAALIASMQ